jgi:hypothetical protein
MRLNLVVLILVLGHVDISGQSFVTKLRSGGSRTASADTLQSGNIVAAHSFQSGTSLFDPNGALLTTSCHAIGDSLGNNVVMVRMQSIAKINDSLFAFSSATMEGSCAPEQFLVNPMFGTLDTNGTILSAHYYVLNGPNCSFTANDLVRCSNGDHILWGYKSPMFLMRCAQNGAVVWAKSYDELGGVAFVRELPGGDLLVGQNIIPLHGVVTRMAATGEVIWSKSYDTEQGMVCDALIHSDQSFTIVGFTDSLTSAWVPRPPNYQPELYLLRLDGAGEVQWGRSYSTAPFYWYTQRMPRVVVTPDGNMAILATLGPSSDYIREHRPYLMKVDLNADTLWTRSYGEQGLIYQTASILPCADGGVLYTMWDGYFGYLVRTDPEGYLPCNNEHYPLTINNFFLTDTNVVLTPYEGAQMFPAQVEPIPCEDMELQTPCVPNPLATPEWLLAPHVRIRPNPTPGRITMEFTEPVQRNSFYSVLDATGRLLYERPLPPGTIIEDIDLSRFGPGTYILRITDPDGQRNERVVVE